MATGAGALFFWPFIKSMNPAKDVMANASIDDISDIGIATEKLAGRGKPGFYQKKNKKRDKRGKRGKIIRFKTCRNRRGKGYKARVPSYCRYLHLSWLYTI